MTNHYKFGGLNFLTLDIFNRARMKVLVVLALLGVVAAGRRDPHVNFCMGNPQAKEDAEATRLLISTFLPSIIGLDSILFLL